MAVGQRKTTRTAGNWASANAGHPLLMPSTTDQVLASRIALPERPNIYYARLSGPTDALEAARRSLISSSSILESVLSNVSVVHEHCIYLFKIAHEGLDDPLGPLKFDGLQGVRLSVPQNLAHAFVSRPRIVLHTPQCLCVSVALLLWQLTHLHPT